MDEDGTRTGVVGPSGGVVVIWALFLVAIGATVVALPLLAAGWSLVGIELALMWLVGGLAEVVDSWVRRNRGWEGRVTAGVVSAVAVVGYLAILGLILVHLSNASDYYNQRAAGFALAMWLVSGGVMAAVATTAASAGVNLGQALGPAAGVRRWLLLALAAGQSLPLVSGVVVVSLPSHAIPLAVSVLFVVAGGALLALARLR
jgi:hypothetical protein